jgi:hypothetical protein
MMLKNIGFEGFTVKSSKFQVNELTEQGTFNISFSEPNVDFVEADKDNPQHIIMTFDVSMVGHAEGVDASVPEVEPAFEAEFLIETIYIDLNEEAMSEEDINQNLWFFENFNQIATKIASDNIFKNSEIGYMPIPWTGKGVTVAE